MKLLRFCCRRRVVMILVVAMAGLSVTDASAQSGSRGSGRRPMRRMPSDSGSSSRQSDQGRFEQRLWAYLQAQKYRNWAPVPGRSGEAYSGQSPHGAFLKMYLNRTAAGHPTDLPDRAIIVKENYRNDGTTLAAITVMYRTRNYNPEAGDWYWIKYNPDGSVARAPADQGGMLLSGRPAGCIACHSSAEGDDYVFFNDPAEHNE